MRDQIRTILLRLPGGTKLQRLVRYYRLYKSVGGIKSPKEIFSRVYEKNNWGDSESASGEGSTIRYTENIRKEIDRLITRLDVRRLLDAPCGDYNWFRLVPRGERVSYIGGDIVRALVQRNQRTFGNANTSFVELDVTKSPLPTADLWLCRDALFHFSYQDIFRTINNFLDSDIAYLLTSSHTECIQNTDIPTGYYRQLNLERPPFSFCKPAAYIDDWIEGYPIRKLCLWDRHALRSSLSSNESVHRG